jgi:hypothetical protein
LVAIKWHNELIDAAEKTKEKSSTYLSEMQKRKCIISISIAQK